MTEQTACDIISFYDLTGLNYIYHLPFLCRGQDMKEESPARDDLSSLN